MPSGTRRSAAPAPPRRIRQNVYWGTPRRESSLAYSLLMSGTCFQLASERGNPNARAAVDGVIFGFVRHVVHDGYGARCRQRFNGEACGPLITAISAFVRPAKNDFPTRLCSDTESAMRVGLSFFVGSERAARCAFAGLRGIAVKVTLPSTSRLSNSRKKARKSREIARNLQRRENSPRHQVRNPAPTPRIFAHAALRTTPSSRLPWSP